MLLMVILVKGMMMIMDYNENIGAHVSDEYDHMKQMSREGHNALWWPQVLNQALRQQCTCVDYVRSEQWARFIKPTPLQ